MASRSRIGLFGGTFNPVHLGHLVIAQSAMELFELGRVVFMPCCQPPHKSPGELAAVRHRMAMLCGAVESDPRFEVSDIEIRRGGISYAIDTIRELRRRDDGEYCFIIGSDSLKELHLWKDVGELLKLCSFVTLVRPGFDIKGMDPSALKLAPPWPEKLLKNCAEGRRIDVSSSDIRYRVAEGMSIRYLVPEFVEMYIAEHKLYSL